MKKKTVLGIFRFVTMLFYYLEKKEAKNYFRSFKICKYALFKYLKRV